MLVDWTVKVIKFDMLLKEVKFKLEALPESYFINYFEEDFLPELSKICKQLWNIYNRCCEPADNLPMANFQEEIKDILSNGKKQKF